MLRVADKRGSTGAGSRADPLVQTDGDPRAARPLYLRLMAEV